MVVILGFTKVRREIEPRWVSWYIKENYPDAEIRLRCPLGPIPDALKELYGPAKAARVYRPSRPEVDAARIGITGGSQGGGLSFATAALDRSAAVTSRLIPLEPNRRWLLRVEEVPGESVPLSLTLRVTCEAFCYTEPFVVERTQQLD